MLSARHSGHISHLEEITEAVETHDPERAERAAKRQAAVFAEVLQKVIEEFGAEALPVKQRGMREDPS